MRGDIDCADRLSRSRGLPPRVAAGAWQRCDRMPRPACAGAWTGKTHCLGCQCLERSHSYADPIDRERTKKPPRHPPHWASYSLAHHRRAALIADKLPKVSAKPLVFGAPAPAATLGSWTLIAPDRMLATP